MCNAFFRLYVVSTCNDACVFSHDFSLARRQIDNVILANKYFNFQGKCRISLEIWDIWTSITRWNNQRFVNDRLYRCGLVTFALHGNWIKVMWQNDIYVLRKKVQKDRISSRGKFSNVNNRSLWISIFSYYRVIMPLDKVFFFRVNLKKEQITINFSTLDGLRSHTNIISSFFLVSFKRDSVYVIYNKFAQLIVTALSKESPHHSATHHCNNYIRKYKMNNKQISIIC